MADRFKSIPDGYKIIPMKGLEESPLPERPRKPKRNRTEDVNLNTEDLNTEDVNLKEKLNTNDENLNPKDVNAEDLVDLKKNLTVIISVNSHGEVIEDPNKKKCLDIQKFPSNFITVFYKNKGVCGKVIANDIYNKKTSHKQIHKDYVNLINKNYKENKKNKIIYFYNND